MTIAYHLRGYDKRTEVVRVEYDLAGSCLPTIRELVTALPDDPDYIHPYELDGAQVAKLAGRLGIAADPQAYDFFLEADEDVQIVAAKREAIRPEGSLG